MKETALGHVIKTDYRDFSGDLDPGVMQRKKSPHRNQIVYAYEDEAGLLLCTWPDGTTKPALPAPYSEEVWTGLEYMMASHLIQRGLVDEGLTVVRAARARHDGSRRNPWNDIECGSYYARALSSYALVNAYSGLSFDQRCGEIGFRPARAGDGVYFWSAGRGWGVVGLKGSTLTLPVSSAPHR